LAIGISVGVPFDAPLFFLKKSFQYLSFRNIWDLRQLTSKDRFVNAMMAIKVGAARRFRRMPIPWNYESLSMQFGSSARFRPVSPKA
jgi:hypothetical protein